VALLKEKQEKDFIFSYRYDGYDKKMTYSALENGMLLLVTAPVSETDIQKYQLVTVLLIAIVLSTVISYLGILSYTRSIINPLKELTKAAKEVAEGNMDVVLTSRSHDEVGELSVSFQETVDRLRIYMDRMNDLAYRDPLTGVKSKAAYAEETAKINNSIKLGFDQFGIMMLDINGLKRVNDNYGHEAGNTYIVNCCKLICTIFKHSPVFRIGGDEFIALLIGEDLRNVEKLLSRFDVRMKEIQEEATCPEERVSVAAGYAVFDEEKDQTFEDVFKKADEAMYQKKVSMKEGRRD
jgi:diguanylate cyclase (GGDEF)-like protein